VFNSVGNQWIERGTGTLRIFQNSSNFVEVEMKQENTGKLLVSFEVEPNTQLEPSADSTTAWVFKVRGHQIGAEEPRDEVLALQFGSTAVAKQFQAMHRWGQEENLSSSLQTDMSRAQTETAEESSTAEVAQNTSDSETRRYGKKNAQQRLTVDGANCAEKSTPTEIASQPGAKRNTNKKSQRRLTIDGASSAGIDLAKLASEVEDMTLEDAGGAAASKNVKPITPSHDVTAHKGVSKKGYAEDPRMKPQNQDRLVKELDPKTGAWCFCVFDGHGAVGHDVSEYCRKRIAKRTFDHPNFPERPAKALGEAILNIEREMLRSGHIDCRLSGTTAVMSIIYNGVVTCANIGDSRLIRATVQGSSARKPEVLKGFNISFDHKPDLPAEKERIEKNGGWVYAIDYGDDLPSPARVWLKEAQLPGLAMSRSVGDTVGKAAGVISTPEITTHKITDADRYLVIASDGLWEFIETEECVQLTQKWIRQHNKKSATEAVQYLYKESKRRWLENETVTDDTTICIIDVGRFR
jgi:serine/threonine protein phosphatase PrpC